MQVGGFTIEHRSSIGFVSLNSLAVLLAHLLLRRLFGCWHTHMGRPVTLGGETYRACLRCGAQRRFDTEGWNTYGAYYFSREGD